MNDHSIHFEAPIWRYDGKVAWHFISVPKAPSAQIRFWAAGKRSAWGSVRVSVMIGKTSWQTSLFPDSKSGCYLLPIKACVRKQERLQVGDSVSLKLVVLG